MSKLSTEDFKRHLSLIPAAERWGPEWASVTSKKAAEEAIARHFPSEWRSGDAALTLPCIEASQTTHRGRWLYACPKISIGSAAQKKESMLL